MLKTTIFINYHQQCLLQPLFFYFNFKFMVWLTTKTKYHIPVHTGLLAYGINWFCWTFIPQQPLVIVFFFHFSTIFASKTSFNSVLYNLLASIQHNDNTAQINITIWTNILKNIDYTSVVNTFYYMAKVRLGFPIREEVVSFVSREVCAKLFESMIDLVYGLGWN